MNQQQLGITIPLTYELFISSSINNLKYIKSKENVLCICSQCNKTFYMSKTNLYKFINGNHKIKTFCCSDFCKSTVIFGINSHPKTVKCNQCGKEFTKKQFQIRKSNHHFCSQSCSAVYNNAHKTIGTRISKLELCLQKELKSIYPNIIFNFNNKQAINSELDIYIPELKLAFELNGIFHYEPIFGENQLCKIKNNDNNKFQKCIENNISLCVIDVSSQRRFTEKSSQKYLDIIKNIISVFVPREI